VNRYVHLRPEVVPMVAGALWGADAEAVNLATIAVDVAAGFYEEILDARDEEIRYLTDRNRELLGRLDRIRREASA
jgi:hypothetical protein